ncbi:hypothetical protein F4780DRAFT_208248 [Xylariomycetidae sp. FL0641]|nr:hypothetical protein F4780DRAFT_208248 [Xylariomycetidae sp. FL0641]
MPASDASRVTKKKSASSSASSRKEALRLKLRGLVHDMKLFKRGTHRHRRSMKSEQLEPEQAWDVASTSDSPAPSLRAPTIHEIPEQTEQLEQTEPGLLAPPFSESTYKSGLAVHVTLNFEEPLNYSYSRNYEGSPSLQPTDELCDALLRRVDHCSHELITRKDSSALDRTAADGRAKELRFELKVQIVRRGSELWSSRSFKSYQRQPLSTDSAKEIILSAHHMVGLFLRSHDEGFVWKDGPVRDDLAQEQETFPFRPSKVQPLSCIPRAFFLEKSQTFEFIPGYSVKLALTSRHHRRRPSEWHKVVEVNSSQTTPLNLPGAEELFFEASHAMEGLFRAERQDFAERHHSCISTGGCKVCRPHEGDSVELKLTVTNNLGPQFDHLERTIRVRTALFSHSQAQDCIAFTDKTRSALEGVRDHVDHLISGMHDLEFRITELRGRGWTLDEPLIFALSPEESHSRRKVEAILDRVQTGVADMLRGNAIAVRMAAYKRGHFILDKTLVAREPLDTPESRKKSAKKTKSFVLEKLRQRIQQDIDMVCKDTCSINKPQCQADDSSAGAIPSKSQASAPETDVPPSHGGDGESGSHAPDDFEGSIADKSQDEELIYSSGASSPTKKRFPARSLRDPKAGARLFHLRSVSDVRDGVGSERDQQGALQEAPVLVNGARKLEWPRTPTRSRSGTRAGDNATAPHGAFDPAKDSEGGAPDDTGDLSTAPPTPSLLYFGGNSPGSSLIATPRYHGSMPGAEADMYRNCCGDSDIEDSKDTKSVENPERPQSLRDLPVTSPTMRLPRKAAPSPLSQDEVADGHASTPNPECETPTQAEQSHAAEKRLRGDDEDTDTKQADAENLTSSDESHGEETINTQPVAEYPARFDDEKTLERPDASDDMGSEIPQSPSSPTNGGGGNADASSMRPAGGGVFSTGLSPLALPVAPAAVIVELCEPAAPEAQSKPDFDFSSPPTVTEDGSPTTDKSYESPDPDEDFEGPPSPRAHLAAQGQRCQRMSFGSAGILGFHETKFGSMDLRRALVGVSPPRSVCSDGDHGVATPLRPGTPK